MSYQLNAGAVRRFIDPALGSLNLSVEAWSIVHG